MTCFCGVRHALREVVAIFCELKLRVNEVRFVNERLNGRILSSSKSAEEREEVISEFHAQYRRPPTIVLWHTVIFRLIES